MPRVVGWARLGDIRHCTADISRAQALLGYAPQVALPEGVSDVIDQALMQPVQDTSETAKGELEQLGLLR